MKDGFNLISNDNFICVKFFKIIKLDLLYFFYFILIQKLFFILS